MNVFQRSVKDAHPDAPGERVYVSAINGMASNGMHVQGMDVFASLKKMGALSARAYLSALGVCAAAADSKQAERLLDDMAEANVSSDRDMLRAFNLALRSCVGDGGADASS